MALQVVLADTQVVFLAGMARVLTAEPDIHVLAQYPDIERLRASRHDLRDAIAVFSANLTTDLRGLLDWIENAGCRSVLILEHGATVGPAVARRIEGIVQRSVTGRQLVECLRRVGAGESSVHLTGESPMPSPDGVGARVLQRLTPKELQIVSLVAEGSKNKEIATQLGTKEQVVKNYLRSIYDKTGVSDRLELALFTVHHRTLNEAAERVRTSLGRRA